MSVNNKKISRKTVISGKIKGKSLKFYKWGEIGWN